MSNKKYCKYQLLEDDSLGKVSMDQLTSAIKVAVIATALSGE